MDYFLHPFVFSSKQAGGFPLKSYIRSVISECGLTCESPCPDDSCGDFNFGKISQTSPKVDTSGISKEQLDTMLGVLLGQINYLKTEIETLKKQVTPVTSIKEAPVVESKETVAKV